MKLSQIAFKLAKSKVGDLIVGIAFEKFSSILPVNKIIETDKVIAFWHPRPFWEKHILVVPKKSIKSLDSINTKDKEYIFEMFVVVKNLVEKLDWKDKSYSTLINGGKRQEINQLHLHLFSGKEI